MHNCERKWAWLLCNAVASEVSANSRMFLQAASVLDFFGRVPPELPQVSLNPSERDPSHSVWTYSGVLDLLRRAGAVGERSHRPWTDFSTCERRVFLLYDARTDAFALRSIV